MGKLEWFGQPGHFCAADSCRFHLHTHVNGYCVSSIGEYFPKGATKPEEIGGAAKVGAGRTYETMVFKLTADGTDVESWTELDFNAYWDRYAANAGHMLMVKKWGGL